MGSKDAGLLAEKCSVGVGAFLQTGEAAWALAVTVYMMQFSSLCCSLSVKCAEENMVAKLMLSKIVFAI
ncbi:MAG: hypothetical protein ACRC8T_06840 [Acidaminococcaceae bacterium]